MVWEISLKAKIIVEKTYYNPFLRKEFTVTRINGNDCFSIYEDNQEKVWNKNDLRLFIQNTIDKKLEKWEMNLEDDWSFVTQNENNPQKLLNIIGKRYRTEITEEWKDSTNEWFLAEPNSTKGKLGRKLYCGFMNSDSEVEELLYPIIDGRKKSIKTTCMKSDKINNFNNIRQFQDWDDIVFICVFPNHIEGYEIEKDLFLAYLEENPSEVSWAGGKEKKERLENDLLKNDYFQWHLTLPMPVDALTRIF
jgi:hypothetical protein